MQRQDVVMAKDLFQLVSQPRSGNRLEKGAKRYPARVHPQKIMQMHARQPKPRLAMCDALDQEYPFQNARQPARVDIAARGQAASVAQRLPIATHQLKTALRLAGQRLFSLSLIEKRQHLLPLGAAPA